MNTKYPVKLWFGAGDHLCLCHHGFCYHHYYYCLYFMSSNRRDRFIVEKILLVCIQFSGTESPSLFWLPIKNVLKFVSAEPKLSMVIYRTPVILQQKYDPNHDSTSIIRNYPPPPPYEMATKMPKVEVTWKFCKFITALVTIFDHSSVLKFLNLVKKNKQIQFSQLFYFLMHFSFLPWWCTLKMEELVRFCKKMLAGFPTWEIQLLLRIKTKLNLKKYLFIFYFHNKPNTSYKY